MMSSKKYTMKPAKKKTPIEDDSDILESTPQKMPAAASSTSRAKSNFKLSSFPAASKNYTIQPQDAGVTFSYTEIGNTRSRLTSMSTELLLATQLRLKFPTMEWL
jgi:hypothetical protein